MQRYQLYESGELQSVALVVFSAAYSGLKVGLASCAFMIACKINAKYKRAACSGD
jgi:hypothetical protein